MTLIWCRSWYLQWEVTWESVCDTFWKASFCMKKKWRCQHYHMMLRASFIQNWDMTKESVCHTFGRRVFVCKKWCQEHQGVTLAASDPAPRLNDRHIGIKSDYKIYTNLYVCWFFVYRLVWADAKSIGMSYKMNFAANIVLRESSSNTSLNSSNHSWQSRIFLPFQMQQIFFMKLAIH